MEKHGPSYSTYTDKPLIQAAPNLLSYIFIASFCSYQIYWSYGLSQECRCSWGRADRRCSNYIWVINNFNVYQGTSYIGGLTVLIIYCGKFGWGNMSHPSHVFSYFVHWNWGTRCQWQYSWMKMICVGSPIISNVIGKNDYFIPVYWNCSSII